jgi:hypothetical protein
MATGKRTGQRGRSVLGVGKADAPPADPKKLAEAMFEGEAGVVNTEHANDQPTMEVEATIPLQETEGGNPNSPVQTAAAKIEAMFAAIGTSALPETVIPAPPGKNNGLEATEYIVSELLKKAADKRFKKAQEAADASGVFGNRAQYVAGKTLLVFNAPEFTLSAKKGEPSTMVNREQVTEVLKEAAPKRWQELLERCLKPREGAVSIITAMK